MPQNIIDGRQACPETSFALASQRKFALPPIDQSHVGNGYSSLSFLAILFHLFPSGGTGLTLFVQRNKAQGTLAISRQSLFKKCRHILKLIGYKPVISRGSYEKRLILPIKLEELLVTARCWFWLYFSRSNGVSPVPICVEMADADMTVSRWVNAAGVNVVVFTYNRVGKAMVKKVTSLYQ